MKIVVKQLLSPVRLLTTGPGIVPGSSFQNKLELYSSLIAETKFPTHTGQQILFFVINFCRVAHSELVIRNHQNT